MLYSVDFNPNRPLTEDDLARTKAWRGIHTENITGTDHAIRNKNNDYLIDRELQASGQSYTGMKGLGTQDCAIQESMGPIADRSAEHLLLCDTVIVKIRRLLLQTLKDHADGKELPGMKADSFRVRSTRCELKRGEPVGETMAARVRVDGPLVIA
jgi:phthalate 4,5-dioxygenase oxygenase subunit